MSEIQQLFQELFFGSVGGWIGFILVTSIMFLVTFKIKLTGILFMVVSIFLGILMLQNVATNENLMWCGIMYFIVALFLLFMMIRK